MLIRADTRQIESVPGSEQRATWTNICHCGDSTPAYPDWSSIQSIKVESLNSVTVQLQGSSSEESKREKENFVVERNVLLG